jgi:hypothetical protein
MDADGKSKLIRIERLAFAGGIVGQDIADELLNPIGIRLSGRGPTLILLQFVEHKTREPVLLIRRDGLKPFDRFFHQHCHIIEL